MLRSFLVLTLVFAMNLVNAQESAYVAGVVSNKSGNPKESVNIGVLGLPVGTSSAQDGSYKLAVPSDTDIVIVFSFIGFGSEKVQVNLAPGETYNFNQM